MNNQIVIVRKFKGVGIDTKLNGYELSSMKQLQKKVYNGRLVYVGNGIRVGLPSISAAQNKCNIIIDNSLPF